MKILVTGSKGYIALSFQHWMKRHFPKDEVTLISVRNDDWEKHDFTQYEAIIHSAGLVHQNESKKSYEEYYKINVELSEKIANKAIQSNVKQFIFISSMAVFGNTLVIYKDTIPIPKTKYGKSKLDAEKKLRSQFEKSKSLLTIVRPPMIYGRNAPGNAKTIEKLASFFFIFPNYSNPRSFVYVNNLSRILIEVIKLKKSGFVFAQDKEYYSTYDLVEMYRRSKGKKILPFNLFNWLIHLFSFMPLISKVFGVLRYNQSLINSELSSNLLTKKEIINEFNE
jgi:UDP-glucose 4-epimerase